MGVRVMYEDETTDRYGHTVHRVIISSRVPGARLAVVILCHECDRLHCDKCGRPVAAPFAVCPTDGGMPLNKQRLREVREPERS